MPNEDEEQLIAPVVSLGGTSPVTLLEDNLTAREAIRLAIGFLEETAPHMRDYIGQEARYQLALSQHQAREVRLRVVALELLAVSEMISDQEVPK